MAEETVRLKTKICKSCQIEKSLEDFYFEPRVNDKRGSRCCECIRARNREWTRQHPEEAAAHRQRYRDTHKEKDRASRAAAAIVQNEKRRESRNLARIERGFWPLPPRDQRVVGDRKICMDCRRYKPMGEFYQSGAAADHLFSYCKPCAAHRVKKARDAATSDQREKKRSSFRRYSCQRLYGVSYAEIEGMYAEQDGKCPICHTSLSLDVPRTDPRAAGVDHCHSTGNVRGVLCVRCNLGLGNFRDNDDHLLAAIDYLRRSRMEQQND